MIALLQYNFDIIAFSRYYVYTVTMLRGGSATLVEAVHVAIRNEIFRGNYLPGQRLGMVALANRFSVSQSVRYHGSSSESGSTSRWVMVRSLNANRKPKFTARHR